MNTRLAQRLASTAAASALVLGGALAAAPTAAADGHTPTAPAASEAAAKGDPSACNVHGKNYKRDIRKSGVRLRSAPHTGSHIKGLLKKGTNFTVHCSKVPGTATPWYYGKVTSGANDNTMGWVYGAYLT